MVYVILRNGKVLQYNQGRAIAVEGNSFSVRSEDRHGEHFLVARFPMDIVERIEFGKPCQILKEKLLKRKKCY